MKYTVLQIPVPHTEEDKKIFCKYAYMSLDCIDKVHPEYYDKTYEGNLDTAKQTLLIFLKNYSVF